jgi:hypothetical protein
MSNRVGAALVGMGRATAMHTDWRFARPGYERLVDGATWEWTFGRDRVMAFAWFVAVGITTPAVVLLLTH